MMIGRLGVLNAISAQDIFNLQWIYCDITPLFLFTDGETNALTDHVACQGHTANLGEWDQVSHSKTTATPTSQKHVTRPNWTVFTRCDSDQLAYVKTGNKHEQEQQQQQQKADC